MCGAVAESIAGSWRRLLCDAQRKPPPRNPHERWPPIPACLVEAALAVNVQTRQPPHHPPADQVGWRSHAVERRGRGQSCTNLDRDHIGRLPAGRISWPAVRAAVGKIKKELEDGLDDRAHVACARAMPYSIKSITGSSPLGLSSRFSVTWVKVWLHAATDAVLLVLVSVPRSLRYHRSSTKESWAETWAERQNGPRWPVFTSFLAEAVNNDKGLPVSSAVRDTSTTIGTVL